MLGSKLDIRIDFKNPGVQYAQNGIKPVKIYTRDVQNKALTQLKNNAQLSIVYSRIAAMPDVYAGIEAMVGSVIPTLNATVPVAVGVDIG